MKRRRDLEIIENGNNAEADRLTESLMTTLSCFYQDMTVSVFIFSQCKAQIVLTTNIAGMMHTRFSV